MASEPNMSKGEGLVRTYDLLEHLLSDANQSFEIVDKDHESQYLRRCAVRAVFSFIEGIVHILKWEIKSDFRLREANAVLTEKETEFLYEKKKRNDEDFRIFIPIDENLKKTFRLATKVWGIADNYSFNTDGKEYEYFLDAKTARDRLTHPRTYYDIDITTIEMYHLASAYEWISSEFKALMKARVERIAKDLPEDVRQSLYEKQEV